MRTLPARLERITRTTQEVLAYLKKHPKVGEIIFPFDKDFEQWANKVWNFGADLGKEVSLADFRRNITIVLYDEAGTKAISYKLYRCWVSEFQSMADLDANANAVLIQHIKLENEGWERDYSVRAPKEESFTVPV